MPEFLREAIPQCPPDVVPLPGSPGRELRVGAGRHPAINKSSASTISGEASPPLEPAVPDQLEESRELDWPRRDDNPLSSDPRKPR